MDHAEGYQGDDRAVRFADAAFLLLSVEAAKIAPSCALFHWFDQSIIEALLEEDELTLEQMEAVYQEIATLPFVEVLPRGLSFHTLTREGLLQHSMYAHPELLRNAAHCAALMYEAKGEDEHALAEAFFCFMIAGEMQASQALQEKLFEDATQKRNWQYVEMILALQHEAESFPHGNPLPRTEQYFILQGLVYRLQGQQEKAIQMYQQALAINPKNALIYVSRGTAYSEQAHFAQAIDDYQHALRLDRKMSQAYMGRGIIHCKLAHYEEALHDIERAIRYGLGNDITSCYQGDVLRKLGRYEEALDAYNEALDRNHEYVEAFLGKGAVLNQLAAYNETLRVVEQLFLLYPELPAAWTIQGQALYGLHRYEEALAAYEKALIVPSLEVYQGKAQVLSALKRYAEASELYDRANRMAAEQLPEKAPLKQIPNHYNSIHMLHRIDEHMLPQRLQAQQTVLHSQPYRASRKRRQQGNIISWSNSLSFMFSKVTPVAVVAVLCLLFASLLLVRYRGTLTGAFITPKPMANNALKTATAVINASLTATMLATSPNNPFANVVLDDPLTTASSGWSASSICQFTSTGYQVSVTQAHTIQYCLNSGKFGQIAFQVKMTIHQGDCGGLIFRYLDVNDLYFFEVCRDGTYNLDNHINNQWVSLSSSTNSAIHSGDVTNSAIHSGLDVQNTLAVTLQGNTINMYVNGQRIDTATSPVLATSTVGQGQIGFFADDRGNPTSVIYTNALVWTT